MTARSGRKKLKAAEPGTEGRDGPAPAGPAVPADGAVPVGPAGLAPDAGADSALPADPGSTEPGLAAAPGVRRWIGSPIVQGLVAFIVYLAGNILFLTLSILPHLGTPEIATTGVDTNFYIWVLHWWPYALSHHVNPLYSREIGLPGGLNLAWATTMPAVSVALAPVTAAFGSIVAFNLLLIIAAPLSAWGAFVATRRLTGKFWPALLAGTVYGFCYFTVGHITTGQPVLSFNVWLPLIVYLIAVWRDGKLRPASFVALMAVTLALQFLTLMEVSEEITIMGAAAVLIGLVVAGRRHRPAVRRLALLLAMAYVGSLVLVSPYLIYALRHYPAGFVRQAKLYSLNLSYLIVPASNRSLGITSLAHYASRLAPSIGLYAYVGIPLLLVLLALVIFKPRTRLAWLLAALFAVDIALAIGTSLRIGPAWSVGVPWGGIWSLPIIRSAEPERLMLIGYLILAVALAIWLSTPVRRGSIRVVRWALGLLAVAAILADAIPAKPGNYPPPPHATTALPAFIATGEYSHYIRPGEHVIVVSGRGNAGMLFQSATDFYIKIGGGFINQSLTPRTDLPPAVAALVKPDDRNLRLFLRYVHSAGITAILVETDWAPAWTKIFRTLGLPGTTTGGITVYSIPRCFSSGCTLPRDGHLL